MRVRFDDALGPVAAGTYPIIFGAVDNVAAVPIDLDVSSSPLCPPDLVPWHNAFVSIALGAFLSTLEVTWYDRFVVWDLPG